MGDGENGTVKFFTKFITLRDTCSFIHMFVFIKSIFAFKGVDLGYPKIFPSFIFSCRLASGKHLIL
jgi:hypothetical protein